MMLISGLLRTGKTECESLRGVIRCCIVAGKVSVELAAIGSKEENEATNRRKIQI